MISLLRQNTLNLGDDIMTLAALRAIRAAGYEPSGWVDRERIETYPCDTILPMCAWWKFHSQDWPPAPGIRPIMLGVHLRSEVLVRGHERWWRQWGAVGCRDRHTRDMLLSHGVEAYLGGCMTLTLDDWGLGDFAIDEAREERLANALMLPLPDLSSVGGRTVLVDVATTRGCPAWAMDAVRVSHQINRDQYRRLSGDDRLYLAARMVETYSRAGAVVGTRLHAYLPAIAVGRPAVLLGEPDERTRDYLEDWGRPGERIRRRFIDQVRSAMSAP